MVLGGTLIGAFTLAAFYFGLHEYGYGLTSAHISDEALTYARTMAFVVLAASQLFMSLSMRSFSKRIFQLGLFTNMKLIGAIIVGFVLQLSVISIPVLADAFKVKMLSLYDWGLVLLFALVPFMMNELLKSVGKKQSITKNAHAQGTKGTVARRRL